MSDRNRSPAVEFVEEEDRWITARHIESGVASFGDTEAEALRQLADALESHRGKGEPIDNPKAWLRERGIDVEMGIIGSLP
jgi:predicted RNase H-like HicB family nuclease